MNNNNQDKLVFSNLSAVYEERMGKKGPYRALFLKIDRDYEKIIFLTELELKTLINYLKTK